MIDFLLLLFTGAVCLVIGAYFHGPILNGVGYVTDAIKAKLAKKSP